MNPPIATYKVVEKKGNLDCAEFSLCPNCSLHIIEIASGCSFCGWSDRDKLLGGDRKNPRKSSSTLDNKLAIPCLIKQPKQPSLKGVIKKVWGDRFTVYIPSDDSTIAVPKLFVYPDEGKSVGTLQGGNSKCSSKVRTAETDKKVSDTSDKCSRKNIPSSKNIQRKTRRQKGEGSGAIFYRTVTRNGRDYQEAYYHWRENGKQRSKYIPKKLLDSVKQAESRKLPVKDIQ